MADVGNSLLAAPFQNKLRARLEERFREVQLFVFEAAYATGYAPGTEPPQGTDSELAAGIGRMQELMTRPGTWTIREQNFAREWLKAAWSRRNGTRS